MVACLEISFLLSSLATQRISDNQLVLRDNNIFKFNGRKEIY
jgi:hypothetical protein